MTLHTPYIMDGATYSGEELRAIIDAVWSVPGVIGAGDLAVTADGSDMVLTVAAGKAVVAGTVAANQEKYLCWSDSQVTVTIAAAPPAGESRIDLVVATVQDTSADGSGNRLLLIQAVEGTATSGTPAAPATPASSLLLAQVAVGAAVTSLSTGNLTDGRVFAQQPTSVPCGHFYQTSQDVLTSGTFASLNNMTSDFVEGGMLFEANGLVVPIAGKYLVCYQIGWQNGAGAAGASQYYEAAVLHNSTVVRQANTQITEAGYPTCGGSDLLSLAAGDLIQLAGKQDSGGIQGTQPGSTETYLSLLRVAN